MMARAMIMAATAIPALNPVLWVTDRAGCVDDAAAEEAVELEVWDVGVGEACLDEDLDVRSVADLDILNCELEVFEVDEGAVLVGEPEDLEVVEDAVLEVGCADDEVEELRKLVLVLPSPWTPMIVCASPPGIENVPSPLSQSQLPASTED
jgi:hypothetical protein